MLAWWRQGMGATVRRLVQSTPTGSLREVLARASAEVGMELTVWPAARRGTDLSGLALTTRTGRVGLIIVPQDAGEDYQMHVFGHELWHILRGHVCGRTEFGASSPGRLGRLRCRYREASCDRFAMKLGLEVQRYRGSARDPVGCKLFDEVFGLR